MFGFFKKNQQKMKENIKIHNNDKNLVVVDPGASFYKCYGYEGAIADFQSSCTLIDKRTASEDANVITFNGVTYRIGNGFNSTETLKHLKEYLPMVLMGISRIDEKVEFTTNRQGIKEIKLVMLTPSNQMEFVDEYAKKLNREFTINKSTLFGNYNSRYKINLVRICAEGLSSYLSLGKETIRKMNYCLCINIGNSTTDVYLMDCKTNSPIGDAKVVPRGSRQLMEELMDLFIKKGEYVDDELMAQDLFINNNPIIKRCKKDIDNIMYSYWNGIMYSIRKIVAKTPYTATILICGGTANIMQDAITRWFNASQYNFKIKFLADKESRFADAIGAYRMVSGEFKEGIKGIGIKEVQFLESTSTENIEYTEEVQKVEGTKSIEEVESPKGIIIKEGTNLEMSIALENESKGYFPQRVQLSKSTEKISKGEETRRKVQELKAQGFLQKEVQEKLNISLSTVKNKWNAGV